MIKKTSIILSILIQSILLYSQAFSQEINYTKLQGHKGILFNANFDKTGKYLLTASTNGTATIWSVSTGLPNKIFRNPKGGDTYSALLGPAGQKLYTNSNGRIIVWDIETGKIIKTIGQYTGNIGTLSGISPSGQELLSIVIKAHSSGVTSTGAVDIIEISSGKRIKRFEWPQPFSLLSGAPLKALYSPDGKTVFVYFKTKAVLWNIDTGKIIKRFNHQSEIMSVEFNSNSKELFISTKKNLYIWGIQEKKNVLEIPTNNYSIYHAKFLPSKKYIYAGVSSGKVMVWDTKTGSLLRIFKGHNKAIYKLSLSADGKYLISVGLDKKAILWDLKSGKSKFSVTMGIKYDFIQFVEFNALGSKLLISTHEGDARLYSLEEFNG